MKAEVTFREGDPAPEMTRDEVVTWLLGSAGALGLGSALAVTWLVTGVVDDLREGQPLEVETSLGLYSLTVTASGHWWHRVRTYHAEDLGLPPVPVRGRCAWPECGKQIGSGWFCTGTHYNLYVNRYSRQPQDVLREMEGR